MSNGIPTEAEWMLDEYDSPRFWSRVNFHGGTGFTADPLARVTEVDGECWVWSGWKKGLYGQFEVYGRAMPAHRVAYLDMGNKIADAMELDHLCRNPICVRPEHLEPVTHGENIRRGLHPLDNRSSCLHGHDLTPDNIIVRNRSNGTVKSCRICLAESKHRTYLRRKVGSI